MLADTLTEDVRALYSICIMAEDRHAVNPQRVYLYIPPILLLVKNP